MDTLYYRKIAEIILRDESDAVIREAAHRVLGLPRDRGSIRKPDRKALKTWMRAWCDRADSAFAQAEQAREYPWQE
jgi:hypothetical protein